MEEHQKEFLHIKSLINQKHKQLLNNEDFFMIDISEDFRDKIKRFWANATAEQHIAMFLDNNLRGSRMITDALRSFGKMHLEAKRNPGGLQPIDLAISQKTYFNTEELPGFEGRLSMTQLFCNGRDSNGAYRIHNFFYLLPGEKFESEPSETDDMSIGEQLNDLDSDTGSKDAMYCLKLLKAVYGHIKLKYFKMGIFLGDYIPDNLWSAWRYMNCREFTLGPTTIIPCSMYNAFVDSANQYMVDFFEKLQPSMLTALWRANMCIAIFSTLLENNILLAFFADNQKFAIKYGFTTSCKPVPPKASKKRVSGKTQLSGSNAVESVSETTTRGTMMQQGSMELHLSNSNSTHSNGSRSFQSLSSTSQSVSNKSQPLSSKGQATELSLKKPGNHRQGESTTLGDFAEVSPGFNRPLPAPFWPANGYHPTGMPSGILLGGVNHCMATIPMLNRQLQFSGPTMCGAQLPTMCGAQFIKPDPDIIVFAVEPYAFTSSAKEVDVNYLQNARVRLALAQVEASQSLWISPHDQLLLGCFMELRNNRQNSISSHSSGSKELDISGSMWNGTRTGGFTRGAQASSLQGFDLSPIPRDLNLSQLQRSVLGEHAYSPAKKNIRLSSDQGDLSGLDANEDPGPRFARLIRRGIVRLVSRGLEHLENLPTTKIPEGVPPRFQRNRRESQY